MKLHPAWGHGYELAKQSGLKSGTLYPILMRLSDRDYLASQWEESPQQGRPPRHMYRLTSAGLRYAREQIALLSEKDIKPGTSPSGNAA